MNIRLRSVSYLKLEGVKQPTIEDLKQFKLLNIELKDDDIYYDLAPNQEESKRLMLNPKFKSILDIYGFVSPAAIVIEAYVDFYLARTQSVDSYKEIQIRNGLRAEKSFNLILQNMGLYHFYTEPIRDWRTLKPCDFYLPLIGSVEVKSATLFKGSKRCNVNIAEWNAEKPDYLVALDNTSKRYIKLIGAMPAKTVQGYTDSEWHVSYPTHPKDDFWSIPCDQFPIKAEALYKGLIEVKRRIDSLSNIDLNHV